MGIFWMFFGPIEVLWPSPCKNARLALRIGAILFNHHFTRYIEANLATWEQIPIQKYHLCLHLHFTIILLDTQSVAVRVIHYTARIYCITKYFCYRFFKWRLIFLWSLSEKIVGCMILIFVVILIFKKGVTF